MIKRILLKFKGYIMFGMVIVAMAVVMYLMYGRINQLNEEIGKCKQANEQYQKAEQKWQERTTEQNQSIENLRKTEKTLKQRLDESNQKRQRQQSEYEQRIRELIAEDVPQDCDGAMNYLLEEAIEDSN